MLCWTITRNHPWVDGNKRAGYGTLVATLAVNSWRLDPSLSDDEIADRIIEVAASGANHAPFHDRVQLRVRTDNTYRLLFERYAREPLYTSILQAEPDERPEAVGTVATSGPACPVRRHRRSAPGRKPVLHDTQHCTSCSANDR